MTAQAVPAAVAADEPPLQLYLGNYPLAVAKTAYTRRVDTWEA